jgi:hypothetical protein
MTDDRDRGGGDGVRTELIEYLVVAVPARDRLAALVPALASLVDDTHIRILDLVVVARAAAGAVYVEAPAEVEGLAALQLVDGEIGGLITDADAVNAAAGLAPDHVGVVLATEQRWAIPLVEAARRVGGQLVADAPRAAVDPGAQLARLSELRGRELLSAEEYERQRAIVLRGQ